MCSFILLAGFFWKSIGERLNALHPHNAANLKPGVRLHLDDRLGHRGLFSDGAWFRNALRLEVDSFCMRSF